MVLPTIYKIMRKKAELLEILLSEVPDKLNKYSGGLCDVIYYLYYHDMLYTFEERTLVYNLISDERERLHLHGHYPYYFEPGLLEPRIKFLKNLINRNKPWHYRIMNYLLLKLGLKKKC